MLKGQDLVSIGILEVDRCRLQCRASGSRPTLNLSQRFVGASLERRTEAAGASGVLDGPWACTRAAEISDCTVMGVYGFPSDVCTCLADRASHPHMPWGTYLRYMRPLLPTFATVNCLPSRPAEPPSGVMSHLSLSEFFLGRRDADFSS